ncbi:hypothetical protein B0H13DRAFT_1856407 [Mycena leptocephala]|nr:hypothetical protein B0H13DRAFT_1856407 [Mycena leptocephala]
MDVFEGLWGCGWHLLQLAIFKYILWSHLSLNSGGRCDLCPVGQAIQSTPRFHPPTGLAREIVTLCIVHSDYRRCLACLFPSSWYTDFFSGFDPTKDAPVEILHTILLGVVKYIWHISHTPWSPKKKKIYSLRLQSTATDGLSIHAIRANYIMQYVGSLIGRQFKTIAQTNVFHVYGLVTEHQFMAWKAAGELAALLWVPEIGTSMNTGYRDLKVAVANVLDVFSLIDPLKITTKIKLHLLAHIDNAAVEFGPLVGVATEIFESFNAFFRYCSILSNHLAPSRDIALQLGDHEGLKHRLTGGWRSKIGAAQAGPKAQGRLFSQVYTAANAVNYVVGESLDECFVGSWIFAQSATDADSTRISEIFTNSAAVAVVILEVFQVLSVRDELYGMPVLVRRDGETIFTIIPAENVKFKVNVHYDCYRAKCEANGERLRTQERVESDQIKKFIVHEPLDRFIINSHAFHNAHLLRATLPRDLVAPIPLFEEREEKHKEFSATLRQNWASKVAKRNATAAGAKKTAPRKRKARVQLDGDGDEDAGTTAKGRRKEPAQDSPAEQLPEDRGMYEKRKRKPGNCIAG